MVAAWPAGGRRCWRLTATEKLQVILRAEPHPGVSKPGVVGKTTRENGPRWRDRPFRAAPLRPKEKIVENKQCVSYAILRDLPSKTFRPTGKGGSVIANSAGLILVNHISNLETRSRCPEGSCIADSRSAAKSPVNLAMALRDVPRSWRTTIEWRTKRIEQQRGCPPPTNRCNRTW